MALNIVIMAAGKGTRMKSALPKVLHQLAGRSLLQHVLQTAAALGADAHRRGHRAMAPTQVEAAVARAERCASCARMPQLGTGHAVQQAAPLLHDEGTTLILNGDVPLIEAATAARAGRRPAAAERLALLTIDAGRPERLRPHRARRPGAAARASAHRRAQGRERRRSARSARSTPA